MEHVGEHVLEVLLVRKLRRETHPAFCVERDSIGLETELDQVFEQAERAIALSVLWHVVVIAALSDGLDLRVVRGESEVAIAVKAEK